MEIVTDLAPLIAADGFRIGQGRAIPTVAAIVGTLGVVLGGLALARSSRSARIDQFGAMAAAASLASLLIGGFHAARSAGGLGTGNGLAGAIVAILTGLVGLILTGLALTRSRPRPARSSHQIEEGVR